jgi:hypothetical protein
VWPREASWAPIGTRIVSWRWLGVPDKYNPPRAFDSYEKAAAYAQETAGLVEIEYTLRSPEGATWPLRLLLPESHEGDRAVGSEVVGRRYRPGMSYDDVAELPTPEEAEAEVARSGGWIVQETLRLRFPDGEEHEVTGALDY